MNSSNRAFQALVGGASLVAMHRNLDWQTDQGLQLDMGAFVVGLEKATGVAATVAGKPSRAFFGAVLAEVGVQADEALMIGDDIDADVLGAQASGIHGVLVRTGKFRQETLDRATEQPDHVVGSIAEVPALLDASWPSRRKESKVSRFDRQGHRSSGIFDWGMLSP